MDQPGSLLPRRVLVVEDDASLRRMLLVLLNDEGYEAQAAPDGQVALELLRRWQPDLILLDLGMPVLDGWGFRQRQLEDLAIAEIPVVVMTALSDLLHRADQLQAAEILPKPFAIEALLAIIERVLG